MDFELLIGRLSEQETVDRVDGLDKMDWVSPIAKRLWASIESARKDAKIMRRLVLCLGCLLFLSVLPCPAQLSEQDQSAKAAFDQKTIHDPAEYNTYIIALNTQDPVQKAAALEVFISRYPNSVVLEDALENAMAAYQQTGNQVKVEETARRILQVDPDHVRALAILVALTRNAITAGRSKEISALQTLAGRGLKALEGWAKPEGMAPGDFEKLKQQMYVIFYGGEGFAALQSKNYSVAQQNYFKALQIDSEDLQNTYQLAIACLELGNLDVRGFWYVARAIHLSRGNQAAVNGMGAYGQSKYRKYHGSIEGWDDLLRRASETTTPPRDFNVERVVASDTATDKTPASLSSSLSPGHAHEGPASTLPSNKTPAAIAPETSGLRPGVPASVLSSSSSGAGSGVSASVLSSGRSGDESTVSASLLSPGSPGVAHKIPASITSSASPAVAEAQPHRVDERLVRFGKPHRAAEPLPQIPIFLPAWK